MLIWYFWSFRYWLWLHFLLYVFQFEFSCSHIDHSQVIYEFAPKKYLDSKFPDPIFYTFAYYFPEFFPCLIQVLKRVAQTPFLLHFNSIVRIIAWLIQSFANFFFYRCIFPRRLKRSKRKISNILKDYMMKVKILLKTLSKDS